MKNESVNGVNSDCFDLAFFYGGVLYCETVYKSKVKNLGRNEHWFWCFDQPINGELVQFEIIGETNQSADVCLSSIYVNVYCSDMDEIEETINTTYLRVGGVSRSFSIT